MTPDELDERLRRIRFEPRASLGPEIAGRAGRGELPSVPAGRSRGRHAALLAAGIAAAMLAWQLAPGAPDATVDRCCFDLDGGREADDGIVIVARPDESVRELRIYEDRDGSGDFSLGDPVRFSRGADPMMLPPLHPDLVAIQHCCLDYDGGGLDDDGVLVVGRPPDQVVMAALFEIRLPGRSYRTSADDPRRYRLR